MWSLRHGRSKSFRKSRKISKPSMHISERRSDRSSSATWCTGISHPPFSIACRKIRWTRRRWSTTLSRQPQSGGALDEKSDVSGQYYTAFCLLASDFLSCDMPLSQVLVYLFHEPLCGHLALEEKVHCTEFLALFLIDIQAEVRKHNNRECVSLFMNVFQDFKPVFLRHEEIKNEEIWLLLVDNFYRIVAVMRGNDFEFLILQLYFVHLRQEFFVLCY